MAHDEPTSGQLGHLDALLSDPSVWDDPPAGLADDIVAAIAAEAGTEAPSPAAAGSPSAARTSTPRRRWLLPVLSGVAAALLIIAGFAAFDGSGEDDDGVELALDGTDLAPDASATARIAQTPNGTRIRLDLTGLPPAPPGTYYEAWLRVDAEVGVSAGTFHMRGGDGSIELWSGVSPDDYPLVTVTIQDEGGGAGSSGRVVLRGQFVEE